jgi:hypothetical protein
VSRARGNRLQNALARYLLPWYPHAESAGAGRNGSDVLGTPGVVWECKTAFDFKRDFRPAQWVAQARAHRRVGDTASVPVVVYYPPGVGEQNTDSALAIVPMHVLMRLLAESGYAVNPDRKTEELAF